MQHFAFGDRISGVGHYTHDFHALGVDHHLKGEANGVEADPTVRIFVMGGGSGRKNAQGRMDHGGAWRNETAWPLAKARETSFFLHGEGLLSPTSPKRGARPRTYLYDPKHPTPTIGGTVTSTVLTLLVVPSFYDSIEIARDRALAKFQRRALRIHAFPAFMLTLAEAALTLLGVRLLWRGLIRLVRRAAPKCWR